MVLWGIAGLGVLLALVALGSARRASRKLDALTQAYWELRYDFTRLRSQVARLDPEAADEASRPDSPSAGAPPTPSISYVPLSTIRRKDK